MRKYLLFKQTGYGGIQSITCLQPFSDERMNGVKLGDMSGLRRLRAILAYVKHPNKHHVSISSVVENGSSGGVGGGLADKHRDDCGVADGFDR